jgi:hypothetical protein
VIKRSDSNFDDLRHAPIIAQLQRLRQRSESAAMISRFRLVVLCDSHDVVNSASWDSTT